MNSVDLVELFAPIVEEEAQRLVPGIELLALNQPTNQPRGDSGVFYSFLFDYDHGTPREQRRGRGPGLNLETKMTQVVETTVQFSVLHDIGPSLVTAKDIANAIRMRLKSRPILSILRRGGASILKIDVVRNPAISNDQDQFEFMASFDVVFIHNQVLESTMPKVDRAIGKVIGV